MDSTVVLPQIITIVVAFAGGAATWGWWLHQKATAKTRLLKVATNALKQIAKMHSDTDAVEVAAVRAAVEKAQLDSLKALVASM